MVESSICRRGTPDWFFFCCLLLRFLLNVKFLWAIKVATLYVDGGNPLESMYRGNLISSSNCSTGYLILSGTLSEGIANLLIHKYVFFFSNPQRNFSEGCQYPVTHNEHFWDGCQCPWHFLTNFYRGCEQSLSYFKEVVPLTCSGSTLLQKHWRA